MSVLTGLYMDEVIYVLDNLPEGAEVRIVKGAYTGGDYIYDIDIKDEDVFDEMEELLDNQAELAEEDEEEENEEFSGYSEEE